MSHCCQLPDVIIRQDVRYFGQQLIEHVSPFRHGRSADFQFTIQSARSSKRRVQRVGPVPVKFKKGNTNDARMNKCLICENNRYDADM